MSAVPDRQALQPERTALAWQRTAITAAVLLLPLLVMDVRLGAWGLAALASASAILACVVAVQVRHRFAALGADGVSHSPHSYIRLVAWVATLAAGCATTSAVILLLR